MSRILRPAGAVVGLIALFASCTLDKPVSPASTLGRVVAARSSDVEAAAAPAIVISQIYGGGGNSGATLKNDFIELFNPGTSTVTVDGWSVQYASSTGTSWQVTTLVGSIPPGRYYLVQEAAGAGGSVDLPTPDKTGSIAMSATAGKVVVASQTAALTGSCPTANVVDHVGYGGSNCAPPTGGWSTNAPVLSNTTADLRKSDGCTHTGNPASDFATGTPNPRNSAALPRPCGTVDVDHITIDPTSATIVEGNTKQFTAKAFDGLDHELGGVVFSWLSSNTSLVSINGAGLATGIAPGDVQITVRTANATIQRQAVASLHIDEAVLPNLPTTRFSELHYDNIGTDVGEAIEIEGPAGTNLTGWNVVLYNGNNGAQYDTRVLSETIADMCSGRGVIVLRYEQDGIQNGSPDGLALVDGTGHVVEFLSYEGVMTATDGPAAGMVSTDIGVLETSAAHFQTLQRRPSGRWDTLKASTLGGCYGSTPVTPHNQVSFSGRLKTDAPLPVGFEDQLFGTLRSPSDASIATSFTWEALNPDLATIDADGVMHANAAGSATFRATAEDGTSATFTLPMIVATASTTARYGNNAEFGEPSDGDASDDFIIRRTEYTSSFNKNRNIPNWVSYDLEATHIQSGQDRCDCFTYDPMVPFTRYTTADYTGAGAVAGFGIDRGHLARSFDRTSGALDNARTFYFSNIVPQASDNNQGPWANFENYLGGLAQNQNKEVYIIAGASGSQGTVKKEGLITIPEWTWKVAVIMPRDQGLADIHSYRDLEVFAVIIPNKAGVRSSPNDPEDWKKFATTVNAVEALSGYDVLALLQDRIETVVEAGMQDEMALVDDLVAAKKLSPGNGNSLTSKLEAAAASIDRGQNATAVNQFEAFLNEVDAMERSRRLSAADAGTVRVAIQALISSTTP